jgi:hypothetical protein
MDTPRGTTYADIMSAPSQSPRGPRKPVARLQSQHAPPSSRPNPPPPTRAASAPAAYEIIVELVDEPAPPTQGGSYADIMATETPLPSPNATAYLPTPPPTPPILPPPAEQDPSFPPPDALRKSEISSMELPAAVSSAEEREKVGEERASVLFSPAERVSKARYGEWKGLKGDPVKLERLNGPAKFSLESRWASC